MEGYSTKHRWKWALKLATVHVCLSFGVSGCNSQGENDAKHNAQLRDTNGQKMQQAVQGEDKISSKLLAVIQQLQAAGITPDSLQERNLQAFSTPFVKVNSKGEIQAYIHLRTLDDNSLETLETHNVRIEISNPDMRIVQGWVPYYSVESIGQLDIVEKIEAPSYGSTQGAGAGS